MVYFHFFHLLELYETDKVIGNLIFLKISPNNNDNRSYYLQSSMLNIGAGNGTALQYSYLENPMKEEPGGLQSMGSLRVRYD